MVVKITLNVKNNDKKKSCYEVRNIQECEYVFKVLLTLFKIEASFVRLLANRRAVHPR